MSGGKDRTPKVSIIVPAYNAAKYIGECLDSLLSQSEQGLEIIVVNDGSTDSTAEILDGYTDQIKVITQPNGGVSNARNTGIKAANGEFLLFCDADDSYHPEALAYLLGFVDDEVDIVVGQCSYELLSLNHEVHGNVREFTGKEAALMSLYQKKGIDSSPCAKLIRRSLFNLIEPFREHIRYEDLEISLRLLASSRKVVVSDAIVYFYRQHTDSFINSWSKARLDSIKIVDSLIEQAKNYGPSMEMAARSRAFSAACNLLVPAYKHGETEAVRQCLKMIREGKRQALADPEVRFKNKVAALLAYLI